MNNLSLPRTVHLITPAKLNTCILSFTDNLDPTQEIYFFRPFSKRLVTNGNGLITLPHSALLRIFESGRPSSLSNSLLKIFRHIKIDSIILSRYTQEFWDDILEFSRHRRVPAIIHLDDNLLEVPKEVGENIFNLYNSPEKLSGLKWQIKESDLVWSSTQALADQLRVYKPKRICHERIYCSVIENDIVQPVVPNNKIRIGYMASSSHKHDLEYMIDEILPILNEYKNVNLEIFGLKWNHPSFASYGSRIVWHKGVYGTYSGFRKKLNALKWDIGLAPLNPIKYNECKANTKWVEYSCAGTTVLASDHGPYNSLPTDSVAIANKFSWQETLARLIESPKTRREKNINAVNHLRSEYSLDLHAKQIAKVLKSVNVILGATSS